MHSTRTLSLVRTHAHTDDGFCYSLFRIIWVTKSKEEYYCNQIHTTETELQAGVSIQLRHALI